MSDRASAWLRYAEEDLAAARELIANHETIAASHAHQAAEKGLKALQIHLDDDHDRTHDLVRLARVTDAPARFHSVLEDLNPADTAARYPDADEVRFEDPDGTLETVGGLLTWIQQRLSG